MKSNIIPIIVTICIVLFVLYLIWRDNFGNHGSPMHGTNQGVSPSPDTKTLYKLSLRPDPIKMPDMTPLGVRPTKDGHYVLVKGLVNAVLAKRFLLDEIYPEEYKSASNQFKNVTNPAFKGL